MNSLFHSICFYLAALVSLYNATVAKAGVNVGVTFPTRDRVLCDALNDERKQSICDEIMLHIARRDVDGFLSFIDIEYVLPVPDLSETDDPYHCDIIRIEEFNMFKPMFWCRSKWLRKRDADDYTVLMGVFLAGSRHTPGRVFAFRPPAVYSVTVDPVAALDNVDYLLEYEPRGSGST